MSKVQCFTIIGLIICLCLLFYGAYRAGYEHGETDSRQTCPGHYKAVVEKTAADIHIDGVEWVGPGSWVAVRNPDGIWTHCTGGRMLNYGDYCWIEEGTKIRVIKPGTKRHLMQTQDSGPLGCTCPTYTLFYLPAAKFDEFLMQEKRKKAVAQRLEKEKAAVERAIKDNEYYTPPFSSLHHKEKENGESSHARERSNPTRGKSGSGKNE